MRADRGRQRGFPDAEANLGLEPLSSMVDQINDGNWCFADRADDPDDVVEFLFARRIEDFIGSQRRDTLLLALCSAASTSTDRKSVV